jgi:hypothetical protein
VLDLSPVLGLKMLYKGGNYLAAAVLANVARGAPAPLSFGRRAIDKPFAVLDPQNWVNPDNVSSFWIRSLPLQEQTYSIFSLYDRDFSGCRFLRQALTTLQLPLTVLA